MGEQPSGPVPHQLHPLLDRLVQLREAEEVHLDRRAAWLLPSARCCQDHLALLDSAEEGNEGEEAPREEPDGERDLHGGRALCLDHDLSHGGELISI